jgi:aminopeptidase
MPQYDQLVKNVLSTTLGIQPGDDVIVEAWDHGLPLASEFIFQLRELGARPMFLFEHEETFWKSAENLSEDRLGKIGEHEWAAIDKAKSYVFIPGPADGLRIWKNRPKFGASTSYNEEWYARAKRNRLKAARIALGYATAQRARVYNFSLPAWQRSLLAASTIDFSFLKDRVEKLAPLLRSGELKIKAPKGTGLTVRLADRDVHAEDCIVDGGDLDRGENVANIPGGSLLIAPDETSSEGTVVFDRRTSYMGKLVGGVSFAFKNGALTNYTAKASADTFKSTYEKATGDKNRIAAITIGLNPKIRTGFLQDHYAEGVVTVAIGGNNDVGGANKSDFYFSGTLTKATVTKDGDTIIQNGKLVN